MNKEGVVSKKPKKAKRGHPVEYPYTGTDPGHARKHHEGVPEDAATEA